jgi:hypothetical protein
MPPLGHKGPPYFTVEYTGIRCCFTITRSAPPSRPPTHCASWSVYILLVLYSQTHAISKGRTIDLKHSCAHFVHMHRGKHWQYYNVRDVDSGTRRHLSDSSPVVFCTFECAAGVPCQCQDHRKDDLQSALRLYLDPTTPQGWLARYQELPYSQAVEIYFPKPPIRRPSGISVTVTTLTNDLQCFKEHHLDCLVANRPSLRLPAQTANMKRIPEKVVEANAVHPPILTMQVMRPQNQVTLSSTPKTWKMSKVERYKFFDFPRSRREKTRTRCIIEGFRLQVRQHNPPQLSSAYYCSTVYIALLLARSVDYTLPS